MIRFYSWRSYAGICVQVQLDAAGPSAFLGYSFWVFDQVLLLHAGD
jgi:hypothetical protein